MAAIKDVTSPSIEPVKVLTEAENAFNAPKSDDPPPPPEPVATVTLKVELSPLVKVIVLFVALAVLIKEPVAV